MGTPRASQAPRATAATGREDYPRAPRIPVAHATLKHGDPCPEPGCDGRLYLQRQEPAVLVRVTGVAPLQAQVYELERLRCGLCGTVFTAAPPAGVGSAKYDESAAAMIALLKYGCGLPFHRIARLEQALAIPLPATTQWDVVQPAAERLAPAFDELARQAADGTVLYNDDTPMRILKLHRRGPRRGAAAGGQGGAHRGLYLRGGGPERQRPHRPVQDRTLPCRGAPRRGPRPAPGPRRADPDVRCPGPQHPRGPSDPGRQLHPPWATQVRRGLRGLSRGGRLRPGDPAPGVSHRPPGQAGRAFPRRRVCSCTSSRAPRACRRCTTGWTNQIEEHLVEPNCGLGQAIAYMHNHWEKLTLFLRVPGAPLSNNLCERALKKAILHRKNSLFYRTLNGAKVGDLFMSLIHTAELHRVEPFDYLVALLRHAPALALDPAAWMPWNYTATLARLAAEATDPAPD